VFIVGSIALIRDTFYNGHDFEVFWRAGGDLLQGRDPYSLAHERGMVFKYPPWSLPFFLPWSFLPLAVAKALWGVVQIGSLLAACLWLRKLGRSSWVSIFVVGVSFWGLWAVHALDGQIALTILALALWLWPHEPELSPGWRSGALVWALSMKVFTGLPLLGFRIERRWIFALLLSVPILALCSVPALVAGVAGGPLQLLKHWTLAAGSGGTLMGADHIRGSFNPSFTGAVLSWLKVPANDVQSDLLLAVGLGLTLGGAWGVSSRGLPLEIRWAGWLAIVPAIHPLPWWHLFVFSFPLAVLAADRAFRTAQKNPYRKYAASALACIGIFLIGAGTQRFMSLFGLEQAGTFLEQSAGKSFGILCCAGSILFLDRF
jgi:hypothetical protein